MRILKNRVGRVIEPGKVDFLLRTVDEPKEQQVVIKIASSAICGSDLHIFKGKHPSAPLPVTIGHEFAGEVVAVGSKVSKVKIGDRVTVEPVIVCGKCRACRTGNYGYCENISFTYRVGDGAMADYITVEEPYVYKLPEHLSYSAGALIEPLAVAVHAVRRADIKLGEKVLVIGAGAIGILVAALCRRRGAAEVAIADFSQKRLNIALELGATMAINPSKQNVYDVVSKITDGVGMDKTFECVGLEATFNQAMMALRKNGLATIVGIFENPNITIPATRFITHEIRVQGSQGYCWDFPIALEMSKEIDLEKLITHTFKLEDLQQALETCLDRDSGALKVIIHP
ncbi:MAG: alcohol dehydrogenase catalytic domain-containing protein [Tepidanaerobacteraceae bacterium]|nr:alcohol dehydrogenase catalytic domain-containing protein [Tepidanaerobacter sp.]HQA60239.1 alcohol dehydrogenase catalytic domain-containing protein [Tepidanaerobacteraceae bacterium]HQE06344.1 alcohol dehydrogenase catalytic domain-containing protein [Tepidanaerobacteraceae bacterium]